MNENLILQVKQIENKIERLEIQRDFYKELLKRKGEPDRADRN